MGSLGSVGNLPIPVSIGMGVSSDSPSASFEGSPEPI